MKYCDKHQSWYDYNNSCPDCTKFARIAGNIIEGSCVIRSQDDVNSLDSLLSAIRNFVTMGVAVDNSNTIFLTNIGKFNKNGIYTVILDDKSLLTRLDKNSVQFVDGNAILSLKKLYYKCF